MQVRIHGVNGLGLQSGNAAVTAGRDLPWLQPTDPSTDPWTSWAVTYRDVIILDEENLPVAVYNLTVHNLRDQVNRDELTALLTQYATD